jgi:hypothetical protein
VEQRVQSVVQAAPSEAIRFLPRPKPTVRRWQLALWAGLLGLAYVAGSQLAEPMRPLTNFFHSRDAYVYDGEELMRPDPGDDADLDTRRKSIDPAPSAVP